MQHSSVKKLFQEQLSHYADKNQAVDSALIPFILQFMKKKKSKKKIKICEFGGGSGQLLAAIERKNKQILLTNVEIIEDYKRFLASPTIQYITGSVLASGFPNKSYDILVMRDVLHHLVGKTVQETKANQRLALSELQRLVRPGGAIFLEEITNAASFTARMIYFLTSLNAKIGIRVPAIKLSTATIVSFLTPKELLVMVREVFGKTKGITHNIFSIQADWKSKLAHLSTKIEKVIVVIEAPAR